MIENLSIFSVQLNKISHYKKIGYNINVLQQTALLLVNPITVSNFAFLFNCTLAVQTSGPEVIKLEYRLKLKIKHNDWLLADTCPQAANHCTLF